LTINMPECLYQDIWLRVDWLIGQLDTRIARLIDSWIIESQLIEIDTHYYRIDRYRIDRYRIDRYRIDS
jgi:hypothetical protein